MGRSKLVLFDIKDSIEKIKVINHEPTFLELYVLWEGWFDYKKNSLLFCCLGWINKFNLINDVR